MNGFGGPRSRPWAGADNPSQPDARDAAAASSMKGGADAPANASAISFGFAATAVLVSLFLLLAIFEHLIKPGLASSSAAATGRSHHDEEDSGEGSGRGLPPARRHPHDVSADKLRRAPKVEEPVTAAADLPVLMPGQRYPTFLAQPAPLPPCPREGVWWPPHDEQRHSFVPP